MVKNTYKILSQTATVFINSFNRAIWVTSWEVKDFSKEEDEMGGACCTCGIEVHSWFWWGNLKEEDRLEDLAVNGRIILEWILKNRKCVGWINLSQDREE